MAHIDRAEDGQAAIRMIREAVEELFGPLASLDSEEAMRRGPLLVDEAGAIVEALLRIRAEMDRLRR